HYLDMVGVTGSIPVAPTTQRPEKSTSTCMSARASATAPTMLGAVSGCLAHVRCRVADLGEDGARRSHGLPHAFQRRHGGGERSLRRFDRDRKIRRESLEHAHEIERAFARKETLVD